MKYLEYTRPDKTSYICGICGDCDGSTPHLAEEVRGRLDTEWAAIWPQMWAWEQAQMTNIDEIIERVKLRGAIADTYKMTLTREDPT